MANKRFKRLARMYPPGQDHVPEDVPVEEFPLVETGGKKPKSSPAEETAARLIASMRRGLAAANIPHTPMGENKYHIAFSPAAHPHLTTFAESREVTVHPTDAGAQRKAFVQALKLLAADYRGRRLSVKVEPRAETKTTSKDRHVSGAARPQQHGAIISIVGGRGH